VAVTDPYGHARQYAYDAANEQTSTSDALGRTKGYSYDLGESGPVVWPRWSYK
jgi:YD repeat-containing protein